MSCLDAPARRLSGGALCTGAGLQARGGGWGGRGQPMAHARMHTEMGHSSLPCTSQWLGENQTPDLYDQLPWPRPTAPASVSASVPALHRPQAARAALLRRDAAVGVGQEGLDLGEQHAGRSSLHPWKGLAWLGLGCRLPLRAGMKRAHREPGRHTRLCATNQTKSNHPRTPCPHRHPCGGGEPSVPQAGAVPGAHARRLP
jgi:hypothetical protein